LQIESAPSHHPSFLLAQAAPPAYNGRRICYDPTAPKSFNWAQGRHAMAKGQMRSTKEKKKPKAAKNIKKGGATPSPFSSGRMQMQAGQNPNSKKS
jgi:hypothetical protein